MQKLLGLLHKEEYLQGVIWQALELFLEIDDLTWLLMKMKCLHEKADFDKSPISEFFVQLLAYTKSYSSSFHYFEP